MEPTTTPPVMMLGNFKMPDKIGATIVTAGVAAGAAYILWRIEPMLIDLAENTLYLIGMALVGFFVLSTLWQSRDTIWYWQQNQIRKFRRATIGEDPIGILDSVIKRLHRKIDQIQESMASAASALNQQVAAINQAAAEANNEGRLAKVAKDSGKSLVEVKQHAVASERWAKTATELQPDADKMKQMQARYQEALELAQANVADAESQKKIMTLKVRTTEAKKKAFAAFKTLFGASEEWQMWGDAIEIIEQRSYEAEAQIDQLLDSVQPQIGTQKLQQEADAQSAMDRLGLLSKPQAALSSGDVVDGEIIHSSAASKLSVR